ncbi:MAG: DUF1177 domain-containing protein [Candidatus Aminicenantes bacterium]|nr:DUF1177 domain-containing protein [Candidatus Aminicenantes bacterium]
MALKQVIEICDFLERPVIDIRQLKKIFLARGLEEREFGSHKIRGDKAETQFVKIRLRGRSAGSKEKRVPTLGIIGRLGGVGARPHKLGLVSDADGAITALACALKLTDMRSRGDALNGQVIIATHLSPRSPVIPHDPVPFMGAPVSMAVMNRFEVDQEMDAILSIDATKGNRVINHRGFAISPTVKDGYILRVSEELLDIMQTVTGRLPVVFPVTTQDITPYGNGLYHLNSIMQPATATHAPVVGVAITTEAAVPGCATGANQPLDIEMAVRFCIEAAKALGEGKCSFYDHREFKKLISLYGSFEHLKKPTKKGRD